MCLSDKQKEKIDYFDELLLSIDHINSEAEELQDALIFEASEIYNIASKIRKKIIERKNIIIDNNDCNCS